jgi:hypothetical protein
MALRETKAARDASATALTDVGRHGSSGHETH